MHISNRKFHHFNLNNFHRFIPNSINVIHCLLCDVPLILPTLDRFALPPINPSGIFLAKSTLRVGVSLPDHIGRGKKPLSLQEIYHFNLVVAPIFWSVHPNILCA